MVARLLFGLALLVGTGLPAAQSRATPAFGLTLDTSPVEYGKAIAAELHAGYSRPGLDTVDLSALRRDFVVETPDAVVRAHGGQSWRILLYPRRPGRLTIPSLRFHGDESAPLPVEVLPAIGRRDQVPMRVVGKVGNTSVWVGQAVRVVMQVDSDYRFALLSADPARRDGVDIAASPFTRHPAGGPLRTQYRIGWTLYPQAAGTFAIQLPAVRYERDGVVTRRFFPPRIVLHVRALPSFVPPTLPVGRMRLSVSLPSRLFFRAHELFFLTLRIRSEGAPAQSSWEVLRQLRSSGALAIARPTAIPPSSAVRRGGWSEVDYRVAVTPQAMGLIALPSLRLQYFDPASGKIETRRQALGRLLVLDPWVAYLGAAAALLAALALSGAVYRRVRRKLRIYRGYRTALHAIAHAQTPQAIRSGLMEIAAAEAWPPNLTLAAWLERWTARYPGLSAADGVLRLQAGLYGRDPAPLEEIRAGLVALCHRRMPLLKALAPPRAGGRRGD